MSEAAQHPTRPISRDPGFLKRVWAMVVKEFVQMRRDRMTFATMLFIPILQLTLFGYAINTDPKHLPTAVLTRDDGPLTRAAKRLLSGSASSSASAAQLLISTQLAAKRFRLRRDT